jgi:hypothetical protein
VVLFNPNYVPWMTVLGILGAGVGFLIGGGEGDQAIGTALYGLVAGSLAGIVTRIVLRSMTARKAAGQQPGETPGEEAEN